MRLARVYSLSIRNLYLRIFFSLVLVLHRYVRLEREKSISCSIVSIFHTHYSIDIYIYMYFPPYSLLFCRVRYIYINSDAYRSTCFLESMTTISLTNDVIERYKKQNNISSTAFDYLHVLKLNRLEYVKDVNDIYSIILFSSVIVFLRFFFYSLTCNLD
jgi:hypothetical protein